MGSPAANAPRAARPKPRLTFWEIWNMSFGFLGIQIGFALQNANDSPITYTDSEDSDPVLMERTSALS